MKLIHRISLFLIVMIVAIPLVILAQDQPTPSGNDDDLFVPLPNNNDDDLFVPIPTVGDDDDLFVPIPTVDGSDLVVPLPIVTVEGGDLVVPLPEPDTCGNDDPNTIFIPICPPDVTVTPRPHTTAQPATSVVNGLWVLDPKNDFSSTGSCQSTNHHIVDGGPDHNFSGEEEQPTYPVCMTADNQWLSVAEIGTFPLTVPPFYSQQQMKRELVETNGQTTGSINVTTTRQYNVISPTEIEYSYIYQETGGCTTKNTFHYKLKEVNDLVCTGAVMTPDYTPVPTQIPTAKPGETQLPPVTPVPPVKEGRYVITLPPADAKCTADKMPPSDQIDMTYDNNQNLFINFGGSSYTLYWDGGNFYQYRNGNRFGISLYASATQTNFTWNNQGCRIDSDLTLEGAPTPTPVPVEPTAESNTDAAVIAGSTFTTTFATQDALCAAENKPMLPDLNTGVLKAEVDGSFSFSINGSSYTLANQNGYFVFSKANDDGSMLTISMNGFYEGKGSGVYTVIGAGGKMCTALLTFTPAG